jgi:thiol-disulfide isomerase/thioredoxin
MNTIKNNLIKNIGIIIISIILISTSIVLAEKTNDNNKDSIKSNFMSNIFNNPYTGTIKIYIAEPVSRWNMYDGEPYHYAFLDFAYNDEISIEYQDTIENTITWNGDVSENNVIVIASIFNSKSYTEYAYPPFTNRFDAFYVDAAAGAKPGQTDYNKVTEEFTHTVFIEEGTATWCHNCPDMANKLNDLYNSEEYPLYFVALVSDENDDANSRLIDDYNVYGYPTAFFDGGKNVIVGSGVSVNTYISKIMNCGQRDVHELNLSLSVEWLGNGNLEITYSITNNENIENFSPEIPTITGPTRAKINENIEYSITCIDPDGDEIYYFIEWGDGDIEEWIGPFESASSININHIWQEKGDFIIRVKAKDDYNSESDWGTLELKMPKFYQYTSYFDLLKNILQFFLK